MTYSIICWTTVEATDVATNIVNFTNGDGDVVVDGTVIRIGEVVYDYLKGLDEYCNGKIDDEDVLWIDGSDYRVTEDD